MTTQNGIVMKLWNVLLAVLLLLSAPLVTAKDESAIDKAVPIRIGLTSSLTGRLAAPGQDQLQGIEMWAADINGRGALLGRKVELVVYDDESSPETSAKLYERLITTDKVDLVLGPYGSAITMAASSVAEKHGMPMLSPSAASEEIWSRGYKNIFQQDAPAGDYMDLLLESANSVGLNRIAMVYRDDDFP